jgi:Co/Zn/Cd efflux system component
LSRPRRCTQATFGTNRLEVLAAVVNALPLFGVLAFLLLRAGAKTSL